MGEFHFERDLEGRPPESQELDPEGTRFLYEFGELASTRPDSILPSDELAKLEHAIHERIDSPGVPRFGSPEMGDTFHPVESDPFADCHLTAAPSQDDGATQYANGSLDSLEQIQMLTPDELESLSAARYAIVEGEAPQSEVDMPQIDIGAKKTG